jgi:hypothetical protein
MCDCVPQQYSQWYCRSGTHTGAHWLGAPIWFSPYIIQNATTYQRQEYSKISYLLTPRICLSGIYLPSEFTILGPGSDSSDPFKPVQQNPHLCESRTGPKVRFSHLSKPWTELSVRSRVVQVQTQVQDWTTATLHSRSLLYTNYIVCYYLSKWVIHVNESHK